ncbi:MAG: hypothetical protein Q9225_001793 [Loekoesia sp. 1 TL-2023]
MTGNTAVRLASSSPAPLATSPPSSPISLGPNSKYPHLSHLLVGSFYMCNNKPIWIFPPGQQRPWLPHPGTGPKYQHGYEYDSLPENYGLDGDGDVNEDVNAGVPGGLGIDTSDSADAMRVVGRSEAVTPSGHIANGVNQADTSSRIDTTISIDGHVNGESSSSTQFQHTSQVADMRPPTTPDRGQRLGSPTQLRSSTLALRVRNQRLRDAKRRRILLRMSGSGDTLPPEWAAEARIHQGPRVHSKWLRDEKDFVEYGQKIPPEGIPACGRVIHPDFGPSWVANLEEDARLIGIMNGTE